MSIATDKWNEIVNEEGDLEQAFHTALPGMIEKLYAEGHRAGIEESIDAYYNCPEGVDPDMAIRSLLESIETTAAESVKTQRVTAKKGVTKP